jgi:SAM-dependent methyltransferase
MLKRAVRATSDWVDLQWSLTIDSLERVAPQARGRLLDVGCGQKPYERIFLPFLREYVGIEREDTFALTHAGEAGARPDVLYDGNRLPFDDRSFDTVLNVQVLEHTPRPLELVKEMARVLKDDGRLILSAPFQFRLHEEPHDYFRYSPHGLRALCREAGLEIVEVYPMGSLWSVIGHKLNSYLALRVARIGGLAQAIGKLSHEGTTLRRTRFWTLPFVGPSMLGISAAARVLDRVAFDPEESLGYLVVARPVKRGGIA